MMIEKTCFVICPLGEPTGPTRARSDLLLNLVLRPVLEPLGYRIDRADLALDGPTIPDTISKHIFRDDLVIADLSDSNANVFYELGKRHALNAACVHFTNSLKTLPFDLRHYRVLEYDLKNPEQLELIRRDLRLAVESQNEPPSPQFPLTPDDVIRLSGKTIVVQMASGRDDPYLAAKSTAAKDTKTMLLMQRSSSLVLGPEQGWGAEEDFYRTLRERVSDGAELFHIVSLEGIVRHLQRPQSTFPAVERALLYLTNIDGLVAIPGKNKPMYIKKLDEHNNHEDIKADRQARTFLVERSNRMTEGNFVIDLGGTQCSFHLRGPEVGLFMRQAIDFYHKHCTYLRWDELTSALAPYRKL